ncbi:hypothetical protein BN946_scf184920.g33 [Trametes cinnabarina]|uniref:Uncharacterized protein n=1 Tax=Pycnoporus cinnabarinus TaxID=5643 RepID=A0A060SHQ6_PYCCI|nr:hypothetical protein BN946_scf184920.g33 [Trametes cinnabarina]
MFAMLCTSLLVPFLLATLVPATALPKRQPSTWESPFPGTILSPTRGQLFQFGSELPFAYQVSSWCEPAFAPFTVYLTAGPNPPVFDNVTADGTLADGSYLVDFGKFVVSRFGLPSPGPAPPSTLTMPLLNVDFTVVSPFFIAVIEEFQGCPASASTCGDIAVEYSLASVPIILGANS